MTGYHKCLKLAEKHCQTFTTRGVKIIRGTMEDIQKLLDRNIQCTERIKIIHLLRDPRGTINSRMHVPWYPHYNSSFRIKKDADRLCNRAMDDIRLRKKLELFYPHSFMEKHYHDMVDDFLKNSEEIYDFVFNTKPPREIYDFMRIVTKGDVTKSGESELHPMNVVKRNSTETARKWTEQLNQDLVKHIEVSCEDLISYLKLDFVAKIW